MCAEAPLRCPACSDHTVEPIEGVRLSVTINGVQSEVHGVSAYRCRQFHIFTLIAPLGSLSPSERTGTLDLADEGARPH
jgi:hypothetical protein